MYSCMLKSSAEDRTLANHEIFTCKVCGAFSSNRIAADDNPMKLMSIAMKPLTAPPFPLERIQEMTDLMGGEGKME